MKKIFFFNLIFSIVLFSCTTTEGEAELVIDNTTKLCALTFDDGPDNEKTAKVLEKLQKHGVKATFFMVGQKINSSTQSLVKEVINGGNEIANHSWSYSGMQDMTAEQVKKSIDDTTSAILEYSGTTPLYFRPPNLSTSPIMYETIDMPFVSGVLAFDWAGQGTTAQDRADKIINGVRDGSIILLHDVQPSPHPTPEALDIIIPELKKRGYEFVTLSELFKRKNVEIDVSSKKMWVTVK